LRSPGSCDGILKLLGQFLTILFAHGREDMPLTVAGTNGESQKDNEP
jgi:hypothetical protein